MRIVAACCLFLTWLREVANALQIADNTCHVVDILGMAVRTLLEIALVNMTAIVADSVGDVEGEVVTSFLCSHLQKVSILLLRCSSRFMWRAEPPVRCSI